MFIVYISYVKLILDLDAFEDGNSYGNWISVKHLIKRLSDLFSISKIKRSALNINLFSISVFYLLLSGNIIY